jgi:hypothetical protein
VVTDVGGVPLSFIISDQQSLLAQLERYGDDQTDGQSEAGPPHESVVAETLEKATDRQQDPEGHKPSLS